MNLRSVRLRLALWNVGVVAVLLVTCGFTLRYLLQANMISAIDMSMDGPVHGIEHFLSDQQPPPPGGPNDSDFHPPDARDNGTPPPGPPPGGFGRDPHDPNNGPPPGGPNGPGGPPDQNGPMQQGPPRPDNGIPRFFHPESVRVATPDGTPYAFGLPMFSESAFRASATGQTVYTITGIGSHELRIVSFPIRRDGHVIAVAQFARPMTPVRQEVARLTRLLLTLIPLALLFAGLGGAFLTDRAIRPVREIASAAATIEAKNLSGRLPVSGHDEFAELATTMNCMLARLEEAFGQLEAANERQRQFTADASHELRTPLTIIKANTSLALASQRSPDEYRRVIATVDRAVDRTSRLVQDLLFIARSDATQLGLVMAPASLYEIVQDSIDSLPEEPFPSIIVSQAVREITINADRNALTRLFCNLLQNAVRHTPIDGKVAIDASRGDNGIRISITDSGEGVAPEHLANLGNRFYRVDAARSRDQGGTGLGLAICKGIVTAHSGSMSFEGRLGEGLKVNLWFPAPAEDDIEFEPAPARLATTAR